MHPQAMSLIPAETERVARAAFPKGSLIMRIADEIGRLMTDRELAQLVPNVGQSALAPGRLLLTDPGFDASVLSASRDRLLAAEQGVAWLEPFLVIGRECGLVQARGKQRTDATHVLGASRTLNRLACLGETRATTLPHLLWEAPAWTRRTIPRDWWVRYQQRFDAQGIDLLGSVHRAPRWQAQAGQGCDLTAFQIDWAQQQVRCPQGQPSRVWSPRHATEGNAVIPIQVDRGTCGSCGERRVWTNAAAGPRTRKRRPQAQHEALHAARTRQETKDFMQRYQRRAGIEGMISQGVHGFDLRYARYRGLAKTALQHSFVALAINLTRLIAWLAERPKAQPRPSRFAAAFQHAGMTLLPVS